MGKAKLRQSKPTSPAGMTAKAPQQPFPIEMYRGSASPVEVQSSLEQLSRVWIAVLVGMTLVAYGPVWNAGFIWDDNDYVTENQTLHDMNGLKRTWLDRRANPQYYPLVHTSFWIEHHLWGVHPLGYHLVNVLFHAANVILIWLVLRRLSVPGAFLAAALFAVHPVEVESVAWITERKNVLSTFFYLCGFLTLLKFWPPEVDRPRPTGRWRLYGCALLLFATALLSKTVACSLPAAFLLVRWWKLGYLSRRDWLMAAPLFALGLGLGINTAILEKEHVGARGADWAFSALDRILIAGRALWFYAGKLIWPMHLNFIYPRWNIDAGVWWQYLFPVTALAAIGALWAFRNRFGRGPLVAVLYFAGALTPALGFFNVYPMRYSFVADHFQYLASVSLLTLLAAALIRVSQSPLVVRVLASSVPTRKALLAGCCLLLGCLTALTWRQCRIYADIDTLYRATLASDPDNWWARYNLGVALEGRGQNEEAIAHYRKALEVKPDFAEAHCAFGNALTAQERIDEAIVHYRRALEIKPDYAVAHNNLGNALARREQFDEAIAHYQKALEIKPDYAAAHTNIGNILAGRERLDEAIEHYRMALEIKPSSAGAHVNFGNAQARRQQFDEAIEQYQKALKIRPDFAEAHINLAYVLAHRGRASEALEHYHKALDLASARNDKALADSVRVRITSLGQ